MTCLSDRIAIRKQVWGTLSILVNSGWHSPPFPLQRLKTTWRAVPAPTWRAVLEPTWRAVSASPGGLYQHPPGGLYQCLQVMPPPPNPQRAATWQQGGRPAALSFLTKLPLAREHFTGLVLKGRKQGKKQQPGIKPLFDLLCLTPHLDRMRLTDFCHKLSSRFEITGRGTIAVGVLSTVSVFLSSK